MSTAGVPAGVPDTFTELPRRGSFTHVVGPFWADPAGSTHNVVTPDFFTTNDPLTSPGQQLRGYSVPTIDWGAPPQAPANSYPSALFATGPIAVKGQTEAVAQRFEVWRPGMELSDQDRYTVNGNFAVTGSNPGGAVLDAVLTFGGEGQADWEVHHVAIPLKADGTFALTVSTPSNQQLSLKGAVTNGGWLNANVDYREGIHHTTAVLNTELLPP